MLVLLINVCYWIQVITPVSPSTDKETNTVTKLNPCELKICSHGCRVEAGAAKCTCPRGHHLNADGFSCRGEYLSIRKSVLLGRIVWSVL